MKSLLLKLLQGFLILVALSLLVAVLVPWGKVDPTPFPALSPNARTADLQPSRVRPESVAPDVVLALFVKKNPPSTPRPAATPEAPKPVEAPWLVFLGFYSSAEGDAYYVLKDARSGRVITIGSRGVSATGWAVIAVEGRRIIVRKDSDTYIVQKR